MSKRITIIGPAYPYRGGIASFDEMLARTYTARGDQTRIVTFTLQYPSLLFPGKTQYSVSPAPEDLEIERKVNSINPFNWLRVGNAIGRARPDMVIMKYWTPFLAPCLGTIARCIRRNRYTKVIVQVDNIVPHEHNFTDRIFNKYFVRSVDGFVYMSGQVKRDLDDLGIKKPALFSPHPIFTGYGKTVPREEACRKLELDPGMHYSLFFGLVRDYKGLDLLLDAWARLKSDGLTGGYRLIVAGEFYGNKEKYLRQIETNGLEKDVIVLDFYIPDEDVKYYFSAADVLIQPYHSATQSGVTQIAYNFGLPMIVTDVGGLSEIVADNVVGYVVEGTSEAIANAFEKLYSDGNLERFRENLVQEKERFSWDAMCDRIDEVFAIVNSGDKSVGIGDAGEANI